MHSAHSLSSNSSWNGLRHNDSSSIAALRNALIADGKKNGFGKQNCKFSETLKKADSDPAIMKGLT